MPIIKYAQTQFNLQEIHDSESALSNPHARALLLNPKIADADEEIRKRFLKYANHLKRVAPKANDFLYFSCIMMHSAEASLIDFNIGSIKKDSAGNDVTSKWVKNDKTGSWKWECSDLNIKPYKNNNGDIFPESELKLAYRKWIGRPLCKDHQSSSVDGIRGIIVDTYYDDTRKRVIALCALDKINYPDLARKVSTGYATNVSMGTAVGRSICFECGNVAQTESEYCEHVKNRTTYGEINIDLSPIELSLVVTGADPGATLKSIIASVDKYSEEKKERIEELRRAGCVTPGELEKLVNEVNDLRKTVKALFDSPLNKQAAVADVEIRNLSEALENITNPTIRQSIEKRIAELIGDNKEAVEVNPPYGIAGNKEMTGGKGQSGGQDLQSDGPTDLNNPTGFDTRFASKNLTNQISEINIKLNAMEHALRDLTCGVQGVSKKEEHLMVDKLSERAMARRAMFQKSAYHQGGGGLNDPSVTPYPVDPLNVQTRDKEDKQMVGLYLDENPENLGGGAEEASLKKKLSRAELIERRMRRHAFLASGQEVESFKTKDGKIVSYDSTTGKTQIAQAEDDLLNMEDVFGGNAEDEMYAIDKSAYFQGGGGVNEPQVYSKDPMAEAVRNKEDKQMVGMYLDENPENLGGGASELAEKKRLLRADQKLRAKFVLSFKNEDKTIIDKDNSRWEIYVGPQKVVSATGAEIYEDELEKNWGLLASKQYGREVLRAIREQGLDKVAYLLKGDGFSKTAQPPMPGVTPAAPTAPVDAPADPLDVGGDVEPDADPLDVGSGDPVETTIETLTQHLEEAEKALGDLKDALQETTGETEAELPSPAEADDSEEVASADAADHIQELFASLDESADELAMLAESIESRVKAGKSNKDVITAELLRLSKVALEENVELCKQAALVTESAKKKDDDDKESKKDDKESKKDGKKGKLPPALEKAIKDKKDKKDDKESKKDDKESKKDDEDDKESKKDDKKKSKAEMLLENLLKARATKRREMIRQAEEGDDTLAEAMGEGSEGEGLEARVHELEAKLEKLMGGGEEMDIGEESEAHPEMSDELGFEVSEDPEAMTMALDDELAQMLSDGEELEADDEELEADDDDLAAIARKEWRNQIAKEAAGLNAKYDLSLDSQTTVDTDMPVGKSHALEGLDTKSKEATFEGIVEMHNEIMKQVQSLPKVREAMEHLGGLLKSGKLAVTDLDDHNKLQALAVDPAAAKYWKDLYNQGDSECKSFAKELTKEFSKKKSEASLDDQKIRMKRSYDLALDMQDKGIISEGMATLHAQVDDLMKLNDSSFESLKKVVARTNKPTTIKTASAIQVGINNEEMLGEGSFTDDNLANQMRRLWEK